MQQWEYLQVYVYGWEWADSAGRSGKLPTFKPRGETAVAAALLSELGLLGWELTGTTSGFSQSAYQLFLKRPKQ